MTTLHSFRAGAVLLLLALNLSCKSAPPPPPNGDTAATPAPGDSAQPAPDSAGSADTAPVAPPPGDTSRRMATLADLRAEVMRMIANVTATDAGFCRTIAFGSKPCGGPQQYLIYSASATDSTALAAAVARYNALESEINKREGRISDCMMVTQPQVALVNGRCTAAPAGTGGK
jgi:hypothetical protein